MIFGREPILFLAAIDAIIVAAVGFGLPVTPQQLALLNGAVAAIVGFWGRSRVSPVGPTRG